MINKILTIIFLLSSCKAIELTTLETADKVIETEIKEIEK